MNQVFDAALLTENQANSRTILYLHVMSRATLAASAVGSVVAIGVSVARKRPVFSTLVRYNSYAALVGLTAGAAMTTFKMQEKEDIEWKDRAWRLLHNKKQNTMDLYETTGMAVGAASLLVLRLKGLSPLQRAIGGIGLGGVLGALTMLGAAKLEKDE